MSDFTSNTVYQRSVWSPMLLFHADTKPMAELALKMAHGLRQRKWCPTTSRLDMPTSPFIRSTSISRLQSRRIIPVCVFVCLPK